MGRGRAKAKQTKVARALKYSSPDTNFSALEQELHSSTDRFGMRNTPREVPEPEPETDTGEDDDYGSWASGSH
jgi:hypothetical protein